MISLKKTALIVLSALLSLALTGCASSEELSCPAATTGDQVSGITAETPASGAPVISFATPLNAATIQTKVLSEGDGPIFTGRNLIEFEFAAYNGGTGALIQQSAFDGSAPAAGFFGPGQIPNFCEALAGVHEGSKIVSIIPPDQAHQGQGIAQLGVGASDSFVIYFDVKKVYLSQAEGEAQLPQAGFPNVVTTPEGIPGITAPKSDAPTELMVEQLIRGNGDVVEEGQTVTLHYSGFLWATGKKFDSSWDNGQPVQFTMEKGGLIDGFLNSVVGQSVGSRVVAVIPPALGYGDTDNGAIPAGSTLIFVIDILGTRD